MRAEWWLVPVIFLSGALAALALVALTMGTSVKPESVYKQLVEVVK